MIFFCVAILLIKVFRLYIALVNLFTRPQLPTISRIKDSPKVSILIRADNHSGAFYHLINMVHHLEYPSLEVIVCAFEDDLTTIDKINQQIGDDPRFRFIKISEPPSGWSRFAYMNYKLGEKASGTYLIFTNSEIEIKNRIIETLIDKMRKTKVSLISVLPEYDINTFAEWSTLPIFNYIYLTLFPFNKRRILKDPYFKAEGNVFLFFDGNAYRSFQPYDEIKNNKNNSDSVAGYYCRENLQISFFMGKRNIRLEGEVYWNRCIARMALQLFHIFFYKKTSSVIYLLFGLLWFIPFIIVHAWGLLVMAIIINIITRIIIGKILDENLFKYTFYSIPQNFILYFIVFLIIKNKFLHKRKCKCKCRYQK